MLAFIRWFAVLATLHHAGSTTSRPSHQRQRFYDEVAKRYTKRTEHGIHIPLIRGEATSSHGLEARDNAVLGLGNYLDVSYNVLITIGERALPVVLDTGSSDLWVISDRCEMCGDGVPFYPQDTFKSTGMELQLNYGDSMTKTQARGLIGRDTVNLGGLMLADQLFGAMNFTNTTIEVVGSSGIFGLGFPINSGIWSKAFIAITNSQQGNTNRRHIPQLSSLPFGEPPNGAHYHNEFPDLGFLNGRESNLPVEFPDLAFFPSSGGLQSRQSGESDAGQTVSPLTSIALSTFRDIGPLLTRLTTTNGLTHPMFAVTLNRNTFDIGGNVGMLSVGDLPEGVSPANLTWSPLRKYTAAQGGMPASTDAPTEIYPLAWEVFVDDVFFDGEKLPRSTLSSPEIALSAIVDTGNSLIRGPADVVGEIFRRLGGQRFSCSQPHTLAFSIGGELFPVDPRDFIRPAGLEGFCTSTLTSTDSPVSSGRGYRFSWSFGDPFLKSTLAVFHYGNITHPSQDEPRMGFLSTVPVEANDEYHAAIQAVSALGTYPLASNAAPSRPIAASTNSYGVGEASSTRPVVNSAQSVLCGRADWKRRWISLVVAATIVYTSSGFCGIW